MRFISTKLHGVLDYLIGGLLIAAPWLLDFANGGIESTLPVVLGFSVIAYSLFTDYELGIVRRISMRTHLNFDIAGGILLAASPWLFDFSEFIYKPHLYVGLAEIATALCTNPYRRGPAKEPAAAEKREYHMAGR